MIETLIVLWFLKTIFEVVGEVAVKETALLKGKDVEFRNGRRFRGRGRGALWGTLTNAAGEVWKTNWDARKDLRTEKAQAKADRSAERFRERQERRSARRGGADQTGGPELEIPDWVNGAAADRSGTTPNADRPQPGPADTPADRGSRPGPDQDGQRGPDRTAGPAPSGPEPATSGPEPEAPRTSSADPDRYEPATAVEPARPTLTLVKDADSPSTLAPFPRQPEGDTEMQITETGEKGTLDATDALLEQVKTYINTEILPRLRQGENSLDKVELKDPGVRTPFAMMIQDFMTIASRAQEAQTNLVPHRNVQEAVSSTAGVAATTDYYQRT